MPTSNTTTTTPTPGTIPHYAPGSHLPDRLIEAAQAALDEDRLAARQNAHHELSAAAWHIARGEASQALARMRRAQAYILVSSMKARTHHE